MPRRLIAVGAAATLVPAVLAYAGHERLSLTLLVLVSPFALAWWVRVASPQLTTTYATALVAVVLVASLVILFFEYRWFDRAERIEGSQLLGLAAAGAVGLSVAMLGRAGGNWVVRRQRRARMATDSCEECPTCGVCYEPRTGRCPADGARLLGAPVPQLVSGRYRLERRLGRGGMATVYAARDTSLDRPVAVKIVRPDVIEVPGVAERFQQEARAAARFGHPNVVTVFDYGVTHGQAFLVMELLSGRTLREILRAHERLEPTRAVALLRDITAAVEAAHQRRVIHRDLKPENVSVVADTTGETAKVLDFGLAQLLTDAERDSRTGAAERAIAGTPLYMAPEQLRGEPADASWDVWALTIMAFEMLAGAHPFATTMPGDRGGPSDDGFRARSAHLPESVHAFFARALSIDRGRRPATASAFMTDLERSLRG